MVDEAVFATVVAGNKAEPLAVVEPLHGPLGTHNPAPHCFSMSFGVRGYRTGRGCISCSRTRPPRRAAANLAAAKHKGPERYCPGPESHWYQVRGCVAHFPNAGES